VSDHRSEPFDRPRPTEGQSGDAQGGGGADVGEHPKGTLLIVGIYGALFALGWVILYFFVFLPRGVLTE